MSKTPRTLIQNYLDASKTQSVKRNQHVGLTRTPPEVNSDRRSFKPRISRTPEPYTHSPLVSHEQHGKQKYVSKTPDPYIPSAGKSRPQHDRVSTLRSKRRSVSKNDVEETPRGLIQAFLESEDTTAPLVRYASRTSQGRLSSTQPIASAESGRSSLPRPGNWTIDLDSDTPRTLLQRYILNTTDVIDTPAPRGGIPQPHTPDTPVQQDIYRTPSPFKTNSTGSEDVIPSPRSTRGKTPRSASRRRKEQFSVLMDNVNDTREESMIPPTNPDDYKVPSPFRSFSSDEESFIPETQQSRHVYDRSQHHRGQFNISMTEAMKEEISQYQRSMRYNREKSTETRTTESHYDDEIASDSEKEMGYDDNQGTRLLPLQIQPGTSMLPDWEEYTMPLKDEDTDKSPVISDKDYRNRSLQEGNDSEQRKRYRDNDGKRTGRWSEGHQSRLQSPRENKKRSTEGQRRSMPGQMTVDAYFSPQQTLRHVEGNRSQGNQSESNITTADGFESHSEVRSRRMSQRSPEMIDRMSSRQTDKIMDALSSPKMRSYNEDVDILYSAQKLQYSNKEKPHHHTLPNISGNFSPRITSTQRNVTMETGVVDDDNRLPTVTPSPVVSPSPSPRSLTPSSSVRSSRSRVLMPSQKDNRSTSVSPASSSRSMSSRTSSRLSNLRSITPQHSVTPVTSGSRNLTPGSSARQTRSQDLTPLQTVTPSPVVSSGANSLNESRSSLELQPSSRKSGTDLEVSKQRSKREGRQSLERSRTSENRSRSSVQTPNKSLAASPVVAGRRLAQDMANTLPNNTVNFSPQIASTQNMATISCVGPGSIVQESKITTYAAEEDNELDIDENRETGDDDQWQDEMDAGHEDVNKQQSQQATSTVVAETVPRRKVVRKPRQKSDYSLPVSVVKKQFTHFAGMRVSKEAIEEVMKVSEKYWDILAGDLEAYAKHAGRKKINMSDFVLLFKRQGYVTEKQSLKSLIEKYLPMEEREKLIPVARAGNRIEPPL